MTYFRRGSDPSRPLAIFVPGAAHFARVFYGGHEGGDPRDFVAHWFPQVGGYNFLAVSYPIESDPVAVMTPNRPGLTVREWGAQAVEATRETIKSERLTTSKIILLAWSMGGKVIQPYALAVKEQADVEPKIEVDFAVSLVATPAIRGVRERVALKPTGTGYAHAFVGLSEKYFVSQMHKQNAINAKTIIPDDVYRHEYMGNFPVGIGCYGVRWSEQQQKFVDDPHAGFDVADDMNYSDLPFLCSISCDSPGDLRHAVGDKYTWGFLMTYNLLGAVDAKHRLALAKHDNTDKGRELVRLIHDAPDRFSAVVHGGHHFFVGAKGARRTAELVVEFEKRVAQFRAELKTMLDNIE
jgi:pimeloyl-ACP methyl ester carboxylesterase